MRFRSNADLFVAAVPDLVKNGKFHNKAGRDKWTYLGHCGLSLEATSDPVIDTLGLSPRLLHTMVTVRLMAPNKLSEREENSGRRGRT